MNATPEKQRPVVALAPPVQETEARDQFVEAQIGRALTPDRNPEPLPQALVVQSNEHLYRSVSAMTWRTIRAIRDAVKDIEPEHRETWERVEKAWIASYDAHEATSRK